ncbi:MAG TPA: calcium-binding protein [Solirubrobacterales bacterium]|nr:calcium-binding protein [Solirubrobacterales bacterium]
MFFLPGRKFAVGVLGAIAFVAMPTAATPAGQIVIFGSHGGSTLKLSTRGNKVIVKGRMAHRPPVGCRLKHHRLLAVCPTRNASRMEVDMGPKGDFVKVAERLPMTLTVHLGAGSDKFVGNGERDICYSEGSRRNRCIGGPGNDICITGERNSDCVGGPGNDYCHHGDGSDGCWGGPGNDVCIMGPGEDGCHGGPGNDRLYGGRNPDQLYGGSGHDYCNGGPGIGKSHDCNFGPRH